jgi:glycerol uptake facilitator-like aquaporin
MPFDLSLLIDLLCNKGGDVNLYIGVGHFFLLSFFILSFAAASGGHLNPLITWSTCLTGHTPVARTLMYTTAQVLLMLTWHCGFHACAIQWPSLNP